MLQRLKFQEAKDVAVVFHLGNPPVDLMGYNVVMG